MSRITRTTFTLGTCLTATVLVMGCQQRSESSLSETKAKGEAANVSLVADSELSEQQREELLAAKDALFTQLSGKLMAAMSQGPAQAICWSVNLDFFIGGFS